MVAEKDTQHIDQLRESAKNRILNFPLNVVEYNRADHKHGLLRDTAVLAQTEALLAISEELALIRQHLQNSSARTSSTPPEAPRTPPPGDAHTSYHTKSGQNWPM